MRIWQEILCINLKIKIIAELMMIATMDKDKLDTNIADTVEQLESNQQITIVVI